jgi:hypothetical protein
MTKSEMLRQSALALSQERLQELAGQTEALRKAQLGSVDELAARLEPLAQAMASLTQQTAQTLVQIQSESQARSQAYGAELERMRQQLGAASSQAQGVVGSLGQAGRRLEGKFYVVTGLVAVVSSLITAVLVSGLWLWVSPPATPAINLDAKAVVKLLREAAKEEGTAPGGPSRRKSGP